MKKITKKLIAMFAVLVLALTPLALVGCDKDKAISDKELNDVVYAAANDMYSKHTEFETFEDITYHWTEHTIETETFELDYKNAATDEETTHGTFTDRTETNAQYYVAIKKTAERLLAKYSVTKTTVSTTNDVDADSVLQTETVTTLDRETVTLAPFTAGAETKYGSLYESSHKVGAADAVVTKNYYTYSNTNTLATKVNDYFVKKANDLLEEAFFYASIYRAYYNMGTATRDGNKVTVANTMNIVSTNSDYGSVMNYQVDAKAYFVNNKVDSAKMVGKSESATSTSWQEVSFDYANSATIEVVEGDVTSVENGYTYNSSDHASYTGNLPYITLGMA